MTAGTLTSSQFLSLMEVPSMRGIFVLGSFARHVTIYSQQVRALNLIHALCEEKRLDRDSRIAVIGGGAAGLTAAAGAASRGVQVVLLEKLPGPVQLQRANTKRFLHPHIYYWPNQPTQGDRAGLPLLDWEAGYPHQVFGEIGDRWKEVLKEAGTLITPRYGVKNIDIRHKAEHSSVYVRWKDSLAGGDSPFQVVILAAGFGLDDGADNKLKPYWEDDDLDDRRKWDGKKVLVSGAGDGGLTELMRLCIANFQHQKVIEGFANISNLELLKNELLEVEKGWGKISSSDLTEAYEKTVEKYGGQIDKIVKDKFELRSDTKAVLTNLGDAMLGFNSSILNRFIVSVLHNLNAFKYIPGGIQELSQEATAGKRRVTFKDGQSDDFDLVIQRYGPNSVLKSDFNEIWKACSGLQGEWSKLSQVEDQTWKPMYAQDSFGLDALASYSSARSNTGAQAPPRPQEFDFGGDHWCLVVVPSREKNKPNAETPLEKLMRLVLTDATKLGEIETEARCRIKRGHVTIFLDEYLSDIRSYEWAVRALCSADVAVFDATGYDPALMLMLGIRSVARRGVTLLAINEPITPKSWSELPFNLKELNLFSTSTQHINPKSPDYPTNMLQSFITSGLKNLRDLPHYLDMPAYDWVRRLGPDEEDYQAIPVEEQILLLCPFDPDYTDYSWDTIQGELQAAFSEKNPKKIARIIDTPSPQLVSQRLYDAIRRSALCIVDWTCWRPNVFYELGVRLAVNENGAICIIASEYPGHTTAGKKHNPHIIKTLIDLFKPITFQKDGGMEPFDKMRKRYDAGSKSSDSDGRLANDYTFSLVYNSISPNHEMVNKGVHIELEAFADLTVGKEPKREGTPRTLFSKNESLSREVRANAIERLVAAWHYMDKRRRARELPDESPEKKAFRRIGAKLAAMLDPNDKRDSELIAEILEVTYSEEG